MLIVCLLGRLSSMVSFCAVGLICSLLGFLPIRMVSGPFGPTLSMGLMILFNAFGTFMVLIMVELSLNLHMNIYKWKIKSKLSLSFWSFLYTVVNLMLVMVATLVPFITGEMEYYALFQVFSGKPKPSITTPM